MAAGRGIVGREALRRALRRELARAADGPRTALLVGEPGIGKTVLLDDLRAAGAADGRLVLHGRATEFERRLPFAVLSDALDGYLASLEPHVLRPLGADRLGELAHVLPALAHRPAAPVVPEVERHRLHRAMLALLELLARRRRAVLVLDDLHWADDDSAELLARWLLRPPAAPLLVAAACRPGRLPPALAAALDAAAREGRATVEPVLPLTAGDTARLLGVPPESERAARLHAASGGNPFHAEQLARVPAAVAPAGATVEDVPAGVVAAIEAETAALPPDALLLLRGAAVAGDPFDLPLAAEVSGLGTAEAARALDALAAVGLVRSAGGAARFSFRHPAVRGAVLAGAGPGWRLGAHARAAAALERRGAPAALRAEHLARCAAPGDAQAAAVLREAAAATAGRAPAARARWLRAALDLAPADAVDERLGLLGQLAQSLAATGALEEARERLLEALRLVAEPADLRRPELVLALAAVERFLGRYGEAEARVRATIAGVPAGSPAAARLELAVTTNVLYGERPESSEGFAERALASAQAHDDRALEAAARAALAARAAFLASDPEGRLLTPAEEAVAALPRLGERPESAVLLAWAHLWLERHVQAAERFERVVALSRRTGDSRYLLTAQAALGYVRCVLGDPAGAAGPATDAVEGARLTQVPQMLAWTLYLRSAGALELGDLEVAGAAAQEARSLRATVPGGSVFARCATSVAAEVALREGRPDEALALLGEAALEEVAVFARPRVLARETAAWAHAAVGDAPSARASAEAAARDPGAALPLSAASAARARAAALLGSGDPLGAAEAADAGAQAALRGGGALDRARCLLVAGRALAVAGRERDAGRAFGDALAVADAHGAAGVRDEAARALRRTGARVPRPAPARAGGAGALSPREREVAALVAEGRTNREIAAALHLSEKTVEKHVAAACAKLGVRRRTGVAARLAAGG